MLVFLATCFFQLPDSYEFWYLYYWQMRGLRTEGMRERYVAASAVTCKPAPSKESKPEQKSKTRGATSPPSGVQYYCRRARPAFRWCNPLWWIMKCVTLNQTFFSVFLSPSNLFSVTAQLSRRGKMARLMDFRTVGGSNILNWNLTGLCCNLRKKFR